MAGLRRLWLRLVHAFRPELLDTLVRGATRMRTTISKRPAKKRKLDTR